MTDNPFDRLDAEAARLDRFFAGLTADQWTVESRCPGWDRTAMLAHLIGIEQYIQSGLDNRAAEYATRVGPNLGYEELNERLVARLVTTPTGELLTQWRELVATQHPRLRERGTDASIDTHAGQYPLGRQTWYFATELAIHADDIAVPVTDAERADRLAWRLTFALDALAECSKNVTVSSEGADFWLRTSADSVRLSAEDLIEATAGRLPSDNIPQSLRSALIVLA